MMYRFLVALVSLGLLAGCDSVEIPSWLGGADNKPKLSGERIAILNETRDIAADSSLENVAFQLPPSEANESWAQAMGSESGYAGNPDVSLEPAKHTSARIGEGNGWKQKIFSLPVVAGSVVFAMDARGFISAHQASDISKVFWVSNAAVEDDEPDLLGGGLAYNDGKLFATTGYGKVVAIDPQNGKTLWKQAINIPIRVAPKALADKVVVLTVDNQTYALSALTGDTVWSHRGISEAAGFVTDVTPSLSDSLVVTPYSSGQIVALDFGSGQEAWSDSLIINRRTTASDIFSGIGGVPIIADGVVYAVSNNGLLAATELTRGQRLWEQPISSNNSPWVAGDALFVLSRSSAVMGINRADGRIKWVRQLQQFEDEESKKSPLTWRGPVLAGGKLWVVGRHGVMLRLDPQTGAVEKTLNIPDEVVEAPIIVGKSLYLVTQGATLYEFK